MGKISRLLEARKPVVKDKVSVWPFILVLKLKAPLAFVKILNRNDVMRRRETLFGSGFRLNRDSDVPGTRTDNVMSVGERGKSGSVVTR